MHLAIEYTDRALVFADDAMQAILADQTIIEKANFQQTSLYTSTHACDLNVEAFIRSCIEQRSRS